MSAVDTAPGTLLLVGSVGCGKTTFRQRLAATEIEYVKTQAVESFDGVIDTPGEFLQHGRLQRALQVVAFDADAVVLFLDPTEEQSYIPPGFAGAFNRRVLGVVTKTTLATPAQVDDAVARLRAAGADPVLAVDSVTGAGFDDMREVLGCPSSK